MTLVSLATSCTTRNASLAVLRAPMNQAKNASRVLKIVLSASRRTNAHNVKRLILSLKQNVFINVQLDTSLMSQLSLIIGRVISDVKHATHHATLAQELRLIDVVHVTIVRDTIALS